MSLTNSEFTKLVTEGRWPQQTIVPLDAPYEDLRGVIQNLVLAPLNSAVLITSKRGSVRANHYHKTDWHYCYVVSGRILYFERAVGEKAVPEPLVIAPGQLFFTPPLREHAMVFAEDTIFLTLARNERTHAKHEDDVVRVDFISPTIVERLIGS